MRLAATFGLVYLFAVALAAPKPQLLRDHVGDVQGGPNGFDRQGNQGAC